MFKRDILCINGNVDGVTENKIYTATYVGRSEGVRYYGLIDDYGVYNLFLGSRFITVTNELISNIEEYKNSIK